MNGSHAPHQHPQFLIERQKALSNIARQLHSIIAIQRDIAYHAALYNLNLDLPNERVYIEAISKCSHVHKQDQS
jgi:hypothetical protein